MRLVSTAAGLGALLVLTACGGGSEGGSEESGDQAAEEAAAFAEETPEAVVVTSTSDEGDPVKAWVATDDPHHILQLEVDQGEEPGQIQFSDFDAELDLEEPTDDEVFDISQFRPGAG